MRWLDEEKTGTEIKRIKIEAGSLTGIDFKVACWTGVEIEVRGRD